MVTDLEFQSGYLGLGFVAEKRFYSRSLTETKFHPTGSLGQAGDDLKENGLMYVSGF